MIEQHLLSVRGIMLAHTRKGRLLTLTTLKKWMRLNANVFKVEKIDYAAGPDGLDYLTELLAFAETSNVRLSLRTSPLDDPTQLASWAEAGLYDLLLCLPSEQDPDVLAACFDACAKVDLPVRVLLNAPFKQPFDAESWAQKLGRASTVNITYTNPFAAAISCAGHEESSRAVTDMNALVAALNH